MVYRAEVFCQYTSGRTYSPGNTCSVRSKRMAGCIFFWKKAGLYPAPSSCRFSVPAVSMADFIADSIRADHNRQVLEMQQRHMTEIQMKEAEHKREVSRLTRLVEKLCAWFPLAKEVLRVEKLCAIVGFSTEQTRTLIAGREVTHDGTLYSEEHGRSFTARNVTAKIRQESVSKRLVLYINQTPVGEWFKEQFERLKQSMRQPIQSQRKSKGMKL